MTRFSLFWFPRCACCMPGRWLCSCIFGWTSDSSQYSARFFLYVFSFGFSIRENFGEGLEIYSFPLSLSIAFFYVIVLSCAELAGLNNSVRIPSVFAVIVLYNFWSCQSLQLYVLLCRSVTKIGTSDQQTLLRSCLMDSISRLSMEMSESYSVFSYTDCSLSLNPLVLL
jgi:hypothetical protein